MLYEHPFMS
jgi:hypothetical protein